MKKFPYTSYNRYFLFCFLLWMIAGGVGLIASDKESLFRIFNTHNTPVLDSFMPVATLLGEGITITMIMLMLLVIPSFRNWWYVFAAIGCIALPSIATQIIKGLVNAERPLTYFKSAEWVHILPGWKPLYHHSFPSGHSCGSFAMFCLLSCLLPPGRRYIGVLFFVLACIVGYSRMYLSAHFFADVYVGSLVGVVFAVFILSLLRRYEANYLRQKNELN